MPTDKLDFPSAVVHSDEFNLVVCRGLFSRGRGYAWVSRVHGGPCEELVAGFRPR